MPCDIPSALPFMPCVERSIVDTEPASMESLVNVNFALAISGLLPFHAVDIVLGKDKQREAMRMHLVYC